jgi:hypothetical protein
MGSVRPKDAEGPRGDGQTFRSMAVDGKHAGVICIADPRKLSPEFRSLL